MGKKKSLLKTSLFTVGLLEVVNRIIDSASIANTNTKTGGSYYHWKHGDIYYRTFGEKDYPPMLLIHDLTVWSSEYEWLKMAKVLSDTYRIYCVDLIGCGKSDKPGITYTNYFYVQMITDFVKEVIKTPTLVAATGLSGSFVLMANALDETLFTEIMLVSPESLTTLKKSPDEYSKLWLKLFEIPVIGRSVYYFLTNRSNTEYYLTEKCFLNSFHMEPSITRTYYNAAHARNGNGKYLLASLNSNYLYADISKALQKTTKRIVMAFGDGDPDAKSTLEQYLRLNPDIVVEYIEGAKHLPQLEDESYEEMLELIYHF